MNRAARMVTTRTGITIGLLYQQRPPELGYYAERIQRALLETEPQPPASLLRRMFAVLRVERSQQPIPEKRARPAVPGLHTCNGGHEVRGPLSFPIEPGAAS